MAGQISGPIVRFRVDLSEVKRASTTMNSQMRAAFRASASSARSAGQSMAANFIDPILQKAAKLKAQIAAGLKTPEQAIRSRQKIVTALQTEIELLTRKHNLSAANLVQLKRATLELERQKNALRGLPDVTNRTVGAMGLVGATSRAGSAQRISKAAATVDPLVLQSLRKYGLLEGEAAQQADKLAAAQKRESEAFLATSAKASRARRALQDVGGASSAAAEKSAIAGIKFGSAALQLKGEGQSAAQTADALRRLGASQTEAALAVRAAYGQMGTTAVTKVKSLNDTLRNSVGTLRTLRILSYSTLGLLAVGFYVEEWSRLVQWIKNATLAMDGFDATLRGMEAAATAASLNTYFAGGNIAEEMLNAAKNAKTIGQFQKSQLNLNLKLALLASTRATHTHNEIAAYEQYKQLLKDIAHLAAIHATSLEKEAVKREASLVAQYKGFKYIRSLSQKDFEALKKKNRAQIEGGQAAAAVDRAETAIIIAKLTAQKKVTSEIDKQNAKLQKQLSLYNGLAEGHPPLFGFTPSKIRQRISQQLAKKVLAAGGTLPLYGIGEHGITGLGLGGVTLPPPSVRGGFAAGAFPYGLVPESPFSIEGMKKAARAQKLYEELQARIVSETGNTVARLNLEYQQDVDNYRAMLDAKKISEDGFLKLQSERQQLYFAELEKLRQQDEKKAEATAKQQADRVFAVLSGTSRNFGQAFAQMARSIALAPFQKVFERMFTGVFEQMNSMLGRLASGRTPGIFPSHVSHPSGSIFSRLAHGIGSLFGIHTSGQQAVGLGAMNVNASTVYLNAAALAGTGGALSLLGGKGGIGSLLSGLPLGHGLSTLLGIAAPASGNGLNWNLINNVPFGNIGKASSSMGSFSSLLGKAGALLGGAGLLASALFGGSGHTVGGTLTGAAGGAMTGFALGGPIGAGIGAVAGALAGFFGHRDNTAGFRRHINEAMRRQRITLPPSETFRFGEGANLASTFSHTYSQSGSSFSLVGLKANTPFWAHPIVGTPSGWRAQRQWNQMMSHFQSGLPFFGSGPNPFTAPQYGMPWGLFGLGPNGLYGGGNPLHWGSGLSFGANPNLYGSGGTQHVTTNVNVNFPHYVDQKGAKRVAKEIAHEVARHITPQVRSASSGLGFMMRRGIHGIV